MSTKGWSHSTGKRAVNRVRVYSRRQDSPIYIEWSEKGELNRRSLKAMVGFPVYNREFAVRVAGHFAERLANGHSTAITDKFMEPHVVAGTEDALVERLTLAEDELFVHELPTKPLCGIYFLLNVRNEVIYVGQSTNILARLTAHLRRSPKAITRCAYQPFDVGDLDRAEAFYIHRFTPVGNSRIPPVKRPDEKLTWRESRAEGSLR